MFNNRPIGFFDSGVGGTSIWKAVNHLLPKENTIYLADSKNAPYGEKSSDEILELSVKNTEILLGMDCKMIIVACNTATTNAIQTLRSRYEIPFVGIEPAIKPAANNSKTNSIGVLATKGTLTSTLFTNAAQLYCNTTIVEQIGHGLVELIESGRTNSNEMTALLQTYLQPMIEADVDYLVLGCSHYPYLIPQIKKILPAHVKIIDSGEAVARQTLRILNETGFCDSEHGSHQFFTNKETTVLRSILGPSMNIQHLDF
ncbi:MAG: glutamate racemase [Flavobacterium sp.]|nr:glutamate racemase [Flavobacterium sp.]